MRRHLLDKVEFFESKHIRAVPEEGQTWKVCDDYEVCNPTADGRGAFLQPKYSQYQKDKWTEYKPLQDRPDLFLRFAKLYEQEPSEEAALKWARQHGRLGYTRDGEPVYGKPKRETLSWEEIRPESDYSYVEVDGMLGLFWEEVRRAAGIL